MRLFPAILVDKRWRERIGLKPSATNVPINSPSCRSLGRRLSRLAPCFFIQLGACEVPEYRLRQCKKWSMNALFRKVAGSKISIRSPVALFFVLKFFTNVFPCTGFALGSPNGGSIAAGLQHEQAACLSLHKVQGEVPTAAMS